MKVLAPSLKWLRRAAISVSLLLAFASPAVAADGGYAVHPWVGCEGGYNSGSWDDSGKVYVPCGSPSQIGIYDASAQLLETIPTGRFVTDVAPTRDGRHLYLAGPGGPARLTRNAAGAWVTDSWRPQAYSLWNRDFQVGGHFVATDAAGNVYYADGAWASNSTHTVVKYAPDGRLITRFGEWARTWEHGKFYWALAGLAVSADGATVYTVELGNNRVQQWQRALNGSYAVTRSIGATEANNADRAGYCDYDGWIGKFAAPYDLGTDRAGNLYVINTTCKQVLKFTPGFGALVANLDVRIGDGDYPRPHGFAVGADGTVYVGENQRALRPGRATIPANGAPPLAPRPAPVVQPAAPAPAVAPTAPTPTAPTPVASTPAKDVTAPRLTLAALPLVYRIGQRSYTRLRLRCSERCRVDTYALRANRVLGRRVVSLAANRATTLVVPLGRTPRRAGIVSLELSAQDARGNETSVVRRIRA